MNKSAYYDHLAITVTNLTPSTVYYTLAFAQTNRGFSWGATTGTDRMVISQLEVGKSYTIRTSVDRHGTQHWESCKELARVPGKQPDVSKKAKKTTEVNPLVADLLDFGDDDVVIEPSKFHDNIAEQMLEAIRQAKHAGKPNPYSIQK